MANIITITDFYNESLDIYARLTENQLLNRDDPSKGIFIAESPKVIERALDAGCIPLSFLVEDKHVETQAKELLLRCPDIPVYTAPFEVLTQLTGFALTRGMLCAMRRPALPSVSELCRTSSRIAILENVMNPTNVGAIFRSAAALGIDAVLVTPTCCDPLYRRAVRVSMGTVFQVPWTRIGETVRDWPAAGLETLGRLGYKTAAMALSDDSVPLGDETLAACDKLALVFGTEGDGLSHRTIEGCDFTVRIPMMHGVDSLNVAAASAVTFWELCR